MNPQPNHDRAAKLWARYRKALAAHKIQGKTAEWYIIRIKNFIKSAKGLKLKEHTAEDLKAYFCRQAIENRLDDWQFSQMVDALHILFEETVKSPWAHEFPWDKWKEPHLYFPDQVEHFDQVDRHIPVSGGNKRFTDSIRGRQVIDQYASGFISLRQAVRSRHYSIRTE